MKAATRWAFLVPMLLANLGVASAGPVRTIRVVLPPQLGQVGERTVQVFARQVADRCDARVTTVGKAPLTIELAIEPGLGAEGFKIVDRSSNTIRIVGNDARGLYYGIGKLLHTSRYGDGGFVAGTWRGVSAPVCPVRAIYFATHFRNFYEAAPVEDVQQYLEEICLWGYNTLCVHFPAWQFQDFHDPRAKENLDRLRQLLKTARSIGMNAGLLEAWNGGFASAPRAIWAVDFSRRHGGGSFGRNICPGHPEGRDYLRKLNGELLDQFKDVGLDSVWHWPYDEGGCGCEKCWPWGWRGYVALSKEVTALARARYPGCVSVLSTWCFDYAPGAWRSLPSHADEWEGLSKVLERDKEWVDYILAESHDDFPRYPLEKGVPGGLPLVNFPEISMHGQFPWGGYGANPLPERLQRLWNQTRGKLAGGVPYSEGIFEDINKVICCRFYWDPNQSASETLKEYIAFEFSPEVVGDVLSAIQMMEKNHRRQIARGNYSLNALDDRALSAAELIQRADAVLTPRVRRAWRWQILSLRARIDQELYRNNQGRARPEVFRQACEELVRIYHAENARNAVRPRPIRPFRTRDPMLPADYARAVAQSKPLAWWTMREFRDRKVMDSSGHKNEAECEKGVVLVPSTDPSSKTTLDQAKNQSAFFAGGRVKATILGLNDTYSVELWFHNVLPTAAQPVTGYLFSRGDEPVSTGCGDHLGISGTNRGNGRLSPGRLFFYTGDSLNQMLPGRTVLRPETWNHVVLVREGSQITVYLNGGKTPEISGRIRQGCPADAAAVFVGGRTDNFSGFQGVMRDVSVYDRALTGDEILRHYETTRRE